MNDKIDELVASWIDSGFVDPAGQPMQEIKAAITALVNEARVEAVEDIRILANWKSCQYITVAELTDRLDNLRQQAKQEQEEENK